MKMTPEEFAEKIREYSYYVNVNDMGGAKTVDFKLNTEPKRTSPSCVVYNGGEMVNVTVRLPPMEGCKSQLIAQREAVNLAIEAGFPSSVMAYCRGESHKTHIKLLDPEITEESLISNIESILSILEESE